MNNNNKWFPKANGLWRARAEPAISLKLAAPLLLASLILATPARADVAGAMTEFWDGIGVSNATGPSAYMGQTAGYYTGGNLFMRTPSRNTTIATVNLP
ncbi:MAG: conjugal transfer protein TraH, partial [Alphaproteobacteria bacterium]|nr:conjugal transfer protein TraH [Alphaproteobacteria bacterium]